MDDSARNNIEIQENPPDEKLSLADRLKLFRYHLAATRLQSRKGLTGAELKRAMDTEYQFEPWYYVFVGGENVNATNMWQPISDFAEASDVVDEGQESEKTALWFETADPYSVDVQGTGTIIISDTSNHEHPNVVTATQAGTELKRGMLTDKGDQFLVEYDARDGEVVELTLISHPENIRNTSNTVADSSGPTWDQARFTVRVKRDAEARTKQAMPRLVGPFTGSLRKALKRLKRAGPPPLVN